MTVRRYESLDHLYFLASPHILFCRGESYCGANCSSPEHHLMVLTSSTLVPKTNAYDIRALLRETSEAKGEAGQTKTDVDWTARAVFKTSFSLS